MHKHTHTHTHTPPTYTTHAHSTHAQHTHTHTHTCTPHVHTPCSAAHRSMYMDKEGEGGAASLEERVKRNRYTLAVLLQCLVLL